MVAKERVDRLGGRASTGRDGSIIKASGSLFGEEQLGGIQKRGSHVALVLRPSFAFARVRHYDTFVQRWMANSKPNRHEELSPTG